MKEPWPEEREQNKKSRREVQAPSRRWEKKQTKRVNGGKLWDQLYHEEQMHVDGEIEDAM